MLFLDEFWQVLLKPLMYSIKGGPKEEDGIGALEQTEGFSVIRPVIVRILSE